MRYIKKCRSSIKSSPPGHGGISTFLPFERKKPPKFSGAFLVWVGGLSEIPDRGFEHPVVVVAGHVLVEAVADALAVAHLAEDAAVGGGDALDGVQGAVGVEDFEIVVPDQVMYRQSPY